MKKKKKITLALGEATGHKHVLTCEEDIDVERERDGVAESFGIKEEGTITHEEHQTRVLPPGEYDKSIVKEYDHAQEEAREVID